MDRELALALLIEQLVRTSYSAERQFKIFPLQWSILRYVHAAQPDSRDLNSVASYVGVTYGPASRAVQTLTNRGLLSKHQNPKDGRSTQISITKLGCDILQDDPMQKIAYELKQVPEADLNVFSVVLRNLMVSREMVPKSGETHTSS